jgi:hypothetical protein
LDIQSKAHACDGLIEPQKLGPERNNNISMDLGTKGQAIRDFLFRK